ncbi:hypothetical protein [Klebsiella pneumoniae]|nr:hypothetical protein [Klebsiella pneumoniae]
MNFTDNWSTWGAGGSQNQVGDLTQGQYTPSQSSVMPEQSTTQKLGISGDGNTDFSSVSAPNKGTLGNLGGWLGSGGDMIDSSGDKNNQGTIDKDAFKYKDGEGYLSSSPMVSQAHAMGVAAGQVKAAPRTTTELMASQGRPLLYKSWADFGSSTGGF